MRIEYFQLIDRIIALNLAEHTILTEAIVPTTRTASIMAKAWPMQWRGPAPKGR